MKISCVLLLVFSSLTSLAQIEVVPNNNVQVGPLIGMSPSHGYDDGVNVGPLHTHKFRVDGNANIICPPATYGGWFFENFTNDGTTYSSTPTYNEAALLPNVSHANWIGTPHYRLWSVHTHTLYTLGGSVQSYSDRSLKKNILAIESTESLSKILQLKAYSYDYNEKAFPNTPEGLMPKVLAASDNKIGFIAQEVVEIIPEVVQYNEADELYTMDYTMLIPLLVEAIKEQQVQIDQLSKLLEEK